MPTEGGEARTLVAAQERHATLSGICDQLDLRDVVIYGSVLRNDFTLRSDVDVLAFDDDADEPYRKSLAVGGFEISLNVASPAVLWEDAARQTFGGYYAAKVALPVRPVSARASWVAMRGRELLLRATGYAGLVHSAALDAFPAYRAFAMAKGLVGSSMYDGPGGRQTTEPKLSGANLRALRRFQLEGMRMHEGQLDWWTSYQRRARIPRAWNDDLHDTDR